MICQCGHSVNDHVHMNDDLDVGECTECECSTYAGLASCAIHKWKDADLGFPDGPKQQCAECGDVR